MPSLRQSVFRNPLGSSSLDFDLFWCFSLASNQSQYQHYSSAKECQVTQTNGQRQVYYSLKVYCLLTDHVYVLCRLSLPIFPLLALMVEKLKIHTPVSEQVSMVCEICDASSHGNFMLLCSSLAISYLVSGEKEKRRTSCSRGA